MEGYLKEERYDKESIDRLAGSYKDIINELWEKMYQDLPDALVGKRDFAYIQHRYFQHPQHNYELLLVSKRFSGKPLGILVIQRKEAICQIMDFIGGLKYIPEIIKQIQRISKAWNLEQVTMWITANFVSVFPETEQFDLNIQIPHSIWCQGIPAEKINGHWWLMAGDTDFL